MRGEDVDYIIWTIVLSALLSGNCDLAQVDSFSFRHFQLFSSRMQRFSSSPSSWIYLFHSYFASNLILFKIFYKCDIVIFPSLHGTGTRCKVNFFANFSTDLNYARREGSGAAGLPKEVEEV